MTPPLSALLATAVITGGADFISKTLARPAGAAHLRPGLSGFPVGGAAWRP